jgi:hypothetical protein
MFSGFVVINIQNTVADLVVSTPLLFGKNCSRLGMKTDELYTFFRQHMP